MLCLLAIVASLSAVLLAGIMTGLYFVFSVAVMPALDAIGPRNAIAAMRSINRKIQNPLFFVVFFGTPIAALIAVALLFAFGRTSAAWLMFASALVYLLGSMLPTIRVNVPLNQSLDRAPAMPDDARASEIWAGYSKPWTRWNTIRAWFTGLSLLLAALALMAWHLCG